jgi:histone-lysine N-methyltransferase SUV420H
MSHKLVQHDCNNNCELSREGKQITFRVSKSIAVGEEITAHYGDDYCALCIAASQTVKIS